MKPRPSNPEALRIVAEGRFVPTLVREADGWHARWRVLGETNAALDRAVDAHVREAALTPLSADAEHQEHRTLHDAWLMALKSRTGRVIWDESECAAFAAVVHDWSLRAELDRAACAALRFRLVGGTPGEAMPLSVRCAMPRGRRALRALGAACAVWGTLRGLRAEGDELAVGLVAAEAENFLRTGAPALLAAGYGVEGVDLAVPMTVSADLIAPEKQDDAAQPATLKLTVHVAGEAVTAEEIRFLLDQGSSLVFFRNRWIEVDRNILKEALRVLEAKEPSVRSPVFFALGLGHVGSLELAELRAHGWVRGLVNTLKASKASLGEAEIASAPGLAADLRDYQRRGVAWLKFMTEHGFGALLADDMGLGKTVQTIAWFLATRRRGDTLLVVAPLSLLTNWAHEFARFAPRLNVYVHQGEERLVGNAFRTAADKSDVVITSYSLLVRDYRRLNRYPWSALVLDEAQTLKNPDTHVARAAKALAPRRRVALTGTPIENSVADVWSLEDILNPGFLGTRADFHARFVKPLAQDGHSSAAKRLQHALEPFVLRRVKTDPQIAAEIGEKRIVKEYCALTETQRRRYEEALDVFHVHEKKQGEVFALLTELKLICDGAGKILRLLDLLESIFDAGESALVFTQFAKVGATLVAKMKERFDRPFPFLHGGLDMRSRERAIDAFNAPEPNAFVLSLRAGGFGLNLVKATHVIHFDRWWNPAVENQATDRAHRIGQDKTVFVHEFITSGTIEEHVDEILERKALVAGSVITEAEWLAAARLDNA